MGTWGVALFSDDLAADIRNDFRDLIGDGHSVAQATSKLQADYADSLKDRHEAAVFWLALAVSQWKLGCLEESVLKTALSVIENEQDLDRWDSPKEREQRRAVLAKTKAQLVSPPPPRKVVKKQIKGANDWQIGEVVGFRLKSGRWALFRTIGHHEDKGGRFAVCELLDWLGDAFPTNEALDRLPIRRERSPRATCQFMLGQPRTKKDEERLQRLGYQSTPSQERGEYAVFPFKYVDRMLFEVFNLE